MADLDLRIGAAGNYEAGHSDLKDPDGLKQQSEPMNPELRFLQENATQHALKNFTEIGEPL